MYVYDAVSNWDDYKYRYVALEACRLAYVPSRMKFLFSHTYIAAPACGAPGLVK
jgi:hypothetical protein